MILGVVNGQELTLTAPVMASETIAYLTAEFQFSPDWEGLTKYAFFEKRGQKPYKIELVNDKISEDKQLNLEEGIYEVYLIGIELADGKTYQRITTVVSAIEVEKTGFLDGEPFPVEPPSFGEQLLQRITVLETKAIPKGGKRNYVLTKTSDNDFDTEWKPQTGGGGTADHNELINRDMANQHPISAIDGLTEALAGKQNKGNYALKDEIPDVTGFATKQELAQELNKKQDTGDYALKSELPDTSNFATKQEVAEKADKTEIPTELPTPNKLTITGAATGEFNGSQPLNIYIPEKIHPELVIDFTLQQDVKILKLSECLDGELLADKNTSRIYFEIIVSPIASAENLQNLYVTFNYFEASNGAFTIPQMLWNRKRIGYVLAESAGGAFVCNYQYSGDKNNMKIFKDSEDSNKEFTKISSIRMWNDIFSIPRGTNIKVWRLN